MTNPTDDDPDLRAIFEMHDTYIGTFDWPPGQAALIYERPTEEGTSAHGRLLFQVPDRDGELQWVEPRLNNKARAPGWTRISALDGWRRVSPEDRRTVRALLELVGDMVTRGHQVREVEAVGEPADPRRIWTLLLDRLAHSSNGSAS